MRRPTFTNFLIFGRKSKCFHFPLGNDRQCFHTDYLFYRKAEKGLLKKAYFFSTSALNCFISENQLRARAAIILTNRNVLTFLDKLMFAHY